MDMRGGDGFYIEMIVGPWDKSAFSLSIDDAFAISSQNWKGHRSWVRCCPLYLGLCRQDRFPKLFLGCRSRDNGSTLEVRYTSCLHSSRKVENAGLVVNCIGPESDYRRITHPFVMNLLTRGLIRSSKYQVYSCGWPTRPALTLNAIEGFDTTSNIKIGFKTQK